MTLVVDLAVNRLKGFAFVFHALRRRPKETLYSYRHINNYCDREKISRFSIIIGPADIETAEESRNIEMKRFDINMSAGLMKSRLLAGASHLKEI
jgi:hypothetical protein